MAVFTLDRAGASEVLKIIAAEEVADLAAQVAAAAGPDAVLETRTSKTRFVASIKVPAIQQASDGVLSKAAAGLGLKIQAYPDRDATSERKRVIGFVSKRQWRWAFWSKKPWALDKARETPGDKVTRFQNLPESTGKNSTTKPKRGRPRKSTTK